MKISLEWIRDFVALPSKDPLLIAQDFSLSCAEVEDVQVPFAHLQSISVAEVTQVEPHPAADKLRLATFRSGRESEHTVVCGAPNLRIGMKTAYAPVGVRLPNGLVLEAKKIRGVLSEGMLCSEVELGLGEDSSGIIELPDSASVGVSVAEALSITSAAVFDIDNKSLTHRPDLWGHLGIARELAALYEIPLDNPYMESWEKRLRERTTTDKAPISVVVDPESCCACYYGVSLDGVEIQESPDWMKQRLEAVGLRPINNIVDIGNYVMLELGGPLHMFDRERITGSEIRIDALSTPTSLTLLDESTVELAPGDTVIADSSGPLVVAGIMGGLNSGVLPSTNKVFIEAANWSPWEIRKTSTRIGVRTDSSQRFEKSLDSMLVPRTLLRAMELVLELCPKARVVGGIVSGGPELTAKPAKVLTTSASRICALLGTQIPRARIVKILQQLDFGVEEDGDDALRVTVPTFRATKEFDHENDVAEEVGRIYGYNKIQPVSPMSGIEAVRLPNHKIAQRHVREFLVQRGRCLEVITYPLIGEQALQEALWPDRNSDLVLKNPVSVEADRLRPSLIPLAIRTIALNQKHSHSFRFFEIGRVYHLQRSKDSLAAEPPHLIIGWFSREQSHYLELASLAEDLLASLGLDAHFSPPGEVSPSTLLSPDWPGLHPLERQTISFHGKPQGAIMTLHPHFLRKWKVRGQAHLAVIDLSIPSKQGILDRTEYTPLPRFPSSSFDCTVVIPPATPAEHALEVVRRLKLRHLAECNIADIFQPNGERAERYLTLRSVFRDTSSTLSPETLKEHENAVLEALRKAGYPLKQ